MFVRALCKQKTLGPCNVPDVDNDAGTFGSIKQIWIKWKLFPFTNFYLIEQSYSFFVFCYDILEPKSQFC